MKTFLIILITFLVVGSATAGGGYWYLKHHPNKDKEILQAQVENLEKQVSELKIGSDTSNWKSYSSKELGLAFKYPKEWGEPKIAQEDYAKENLNNPYFAGKNYSVCFEDGKYCAIGFSADYKVYESAAGSYYVGDQKILDAAETDVAKDAKTSSISFVRKAEVAGVKTSTKTYFYYLSEAAGVGVSSLTFLNGKATYPGIVVSTHYQELSDSLQGLYDQKGVDSTELTKQATDELSALKAGSSNSQIQSNLYKTWLSTFQYL